MKKGLIIPTSGRFHIYNVYIIKIYIICIKHHYIHTHKSIVIVSRKGDKSCKFCNCYPGMNLYFKYCCCLVKSCPTLCNHLDSSPPGSSVHGTVQARILECIAISFSRGSSRPRDQTRASCLAVGSFTTEPPGKIKYTLDLIQMHTCLQESFQTPAKKQNSKRI